MVLLDEKDYNERYGWMKKAHPKPPKSGSKIKSHFSLMRSSHRSQGSTRSSQNRVSAADRAAHVEKALAQTKTADATVKGASTASKKT
ncbi:hypothetical protein KVT40_002493 [Elsinoe batatas]|uniref:Uncharacterized protein n=1 Tax=Elsinoe batatas TaxID=2601811 RepID=A0A8K0LAD9_9PEZI|nr:hypothetical protein KVT40_002493 [Elsinoe batatas]